MKKKKSENQNLFRSLHNQNLFVMEEKDVAEHVKNKVQLCMQNYMSLEETANYLEKNHQISQSVTHLVWEQLGIENKDFFNLFHLRRRLALQMKRFNDLLTQQAVAMLENGLLHISDAPPSVKDLLRKQHPDASLALANASGIKTQIRYNQQPQVLNSASYAMPKPNGLPAFQWRIPDHHHLYATSSLQLSNANVTHVPIPYDQQHLHTTNLPLPYANGPSVTHLPIQEEQLHQDPSSAYNNLIYNTLGAPAFEPADTDDWSFPLNDPAAFVADLVTLPPLPPADNTTNPCSSSDHLPYTATMPEEDFSNGPSYDADIILAAIHLDEQQQQQNVQVHGSNGDTIDELLRYNFDITQSMQMDHQQQAGGGVEGHYPYSGVVGHNGVNGSYINAPAQHQNGHYQPPPLQSQRNVLVEETLQRGDRSNGHHHNAENPSKRMCTCVDEEQQAGRVKRHHPESEQALNNPNSGNGTQSAKQQRSPKARATTRSLNEWEQYENE